MPDTFVRGMMIVDLIRSAMDATVQWLPLLATTAIVLAALALLNRGVRYRWRDDVAMQSRFRLVLLLLGVGGALLVAAMLPFDDELRRAWLALVATAGAVVVGLILVNRSLKRRWQDKPDAQFRFQLIMLLLTVVGVLAVIVALPFRQENAELKVELLKLLGVLLSAAIALSSTTFIGNIMAGVMLKTIRSVRPGDFVTLGELTGRVTEMDLLHTEVQTEFRDLVTVPNLSMVTQPIKVVRASGTVITAEVSLGYDVPHAKVGELLNAAAGAAGLKDSFVHVRELGDFSVTYRVAGLLEDVLSLISARSKLRVAMLDALHEAGIEIVSPNFMNTRALAAEARVIPQSAPAPAVPADEPADKAEAIAFDKADDAAAREKLRKAIADIDAELAALPAAPEDDGPDAARKALEAKKSRLSRQLEVAEKRLEEGDSA